jgi:hypothetical protein
MVKVSIFLNKAAELHNLDIQYPVPERPEGNHHYTFPINADRLTDIEIDNWLLFLGAWRSYLNYQISRLDGEHSILSEGYDLLLSSKIAVLEKESEKRLLKDSLKGQALAEDDQLQQLKIRTIELNGELKLLKGRLSLYDSQFETISRVITRRGQERFKI